MDTKFLSKDREIDGVLLAVDEEGRGINRGVKVGISFEFCFIFLFYLFLLLIYTNSMELYLRFASVMGMIYILIHLKFGFFLFNF